MSPEVRLLVSDVDGTLVRHDKSLSDAVVEAARRWRASGVPLSLISARPPSGILWIAQRLELTGEIGAFNGGTIVRCDGTVVSAAHLSPEVAARALAAVDVAGVTPWLFADGKWYARDPENRRVPRERQSANIDAVIVDDFRPLTERVDKIVGVSEDLPLLARLEAEIAAQLGGQATVARSQPYFLDITAPSANKGDGLARLAEAEGVPLESVAVIGDQRNDLPMFARAGLSFAMGQAPDEVRAAATRTTRSNEEDGVAAVIDELLAQRGAA